MIPENELGVVVAFSQRIMETEWVITNVSVQYPDLKLRNKSNGQMVLAEVEFKSSHFKYHGHDLYGCDLIICWEHDWLECPIPVWELSDKCDWIIQETNKKDMEIKYLRYRISQLEKVSVKEDPYLVLPKMSIKQRKQRALDLHRRDLSVAEIARTLEVSERTIYRYIK